jgi:hypothetical protein
MSMFSGAPAPAEPAQHQIKVIADDGPLGGPSHTYRGARIDRMKGDHFCRLALDGRKLSNGERI